MCSIPFHRGGIVGSSLTQDNIFHINASSRSKTRSTYLFVEHSLIQAANQSCLKKDSPEFRRYIKNNRYINTLYQTNKDAKNDFLKKGFSRILLPTQECIHGISNNLKETDLIINVWKHHRFCFHRRNLTT